MSRPRMLLGSAVEGRQKLFGVGLVKRPDVAVRIQAHRGFRVTRPLLLAAVVLAVPAAGFAVCWAAARAVVE